MVKWFFQVCVGKMGNVNCYVFEIEKEVLVFEILMCKVVGFDD